MTSTFTSRGDAQKRCSRFAAGSEVDAFRDPDTGRVYLETRYGRFSNYVVSWIALFLCPILWILIVFLLVVQVVMFFRGESAI